MIFYYWPKKREEVKRQKSKVFRGEQERQSSCSALLDEEMNWKRYKETLG